MEWRAGINSLGSSRKRHPTDELVEEQPLSKRLSLLNLNFGKSVTELYPCRASSNFHKGNDAAQKQKEPLKAASQRPAGEERMEVDNVIYISVVSVDM